MTSSTAFKVFRDLFRSDVPLNVRVPVLTVANDNSRSVLVGGRHYSPLIDTLSDQLAARGVSTLCVSRIASTIRGETSHGPVYAPDGAFARALLQKHARRLVTRKGYPYSSSEERVWGKILDASGARHVIAIQPSRELCVAGRSRDVWVADQQHGVISSEHPWYGSAFRSSEPAEWAPNAFLCWDESSAQVMREWCRPDHSVALVIGHPWLSRFQREQGDDPVVTELTQRFGAALPKRDKQANVLVSLSWGEADIPNGFLVPEMIDAIRVTKDRYHWLIRLHPNQLRGFASGEGESFASFASRHLPPEVEWQMASAAPLPVVLGKCDLHVSWSSSVTIEAAQMGVKTALLNPKLRPGGAFAEYFSQQRREGSAEVIDVSTASILKWLAENAGARTPVAFANARAEYARLLERLSGRTVQTS